MVEDDNINNIKNLSPEERIRKLKKIEEKNKKEIEKAHKLIKESEDEIAIEEKIKQVEIPEKKDIDVAGLFKGEESLEETVQKENPEVNEEEIRNQQNYLRGIPTSKIEERAEYLQQRVEQTGYITNKERNEMSNMYQEINQRENDVRQGTYKSASSNIQEQLSVTKKILGNMYKR